MKRVVLFVAVGGILAAVTLCVAAAAPNSDSSEIDQLKKRVEVLTQRVESLERRLDESRMFMVPRARPLVTPRGRTMPLDPNILPGFRSTPRDWRRFEFNGLPYYIVPIDSGSAPGPGK